MTKSDWDYRGLAAECYDLWFGDEPFWDQAFFHDRIRHNGDVALEIACGTGRLLVPLLRDGLAVEGVDASAEMLAICRTKAAHVGVTPTLYHQLMQDLDLAPRYRTVFIPACSFQILAERDEAFAALRRFYTHLEPGGELLITLMVPWRDFGVERQWRVRRSGVRPSDGATILIHEATVSDRVEQVQHIWMRHEVFKEGLLVQTQLRTHRLRWYHKHEFAMMLESVGFCEVAVQCGYTDSDRANPEAEWIFIAKHQADGHELLNGSPNKAVEPTPNSFRSCVAPAIGRGSPPALDLCTQCCIVLQSREKATLYRAVGASDMTTRRQNVPTSQHNPPPEPIEPTCDSSGVHTAQKRPIWEVIIEIGAQIPDEVWATVPDDASINYKHYLYGAPKKQT